MYISVQTANNNNVANRIGLNTFYVTDVGHEQNIMHYRGGEPFKKLGGGGWGNSSVVGIICPSPLLELEGLTDLPKTGGQLPPPPFRRPCI